MYVGPIFKMTMVTTIKSFIRFTKADQHRSQMQMKYNPKFCLMVNHEYRCNKIWQASIKRIRPLGKYEPQKDGWRYTARAKGTCKHKHVQTRWRAIRIYHIGPPGWNIRGAGSCGGGNSCSLLSFASFFWRELLLQKCSLSFLILKFLFKIRKILLLLLSARHQLVQPKQRQLL